MDGLAAAVGGISERASEQIEGTEFVPFRKSVARFDFDFDLGNLGNGMEWRKTVGRNRHGRIYRTRGHNGRSRFHPSLPNLPACTFSGFLVEFEVSRVLVSLQNIFTAIFGILCASYLCIIGLVKPKYSHFIYLFPIFLLNTLAFYASGTPY